MHVHCCFFKHCVNVTLLVDVRVRLEDQSKTLFAPKSATEFLVGLQCLLLLAPLLRKACLPLVKSRCPRHDLRCGNSVLNKKKEFLSKRDFLETMLY